MIEIQAYDEREAIATIRELLDYDFNTSDERIILEVKRRGLVVDPIWLQTIIEQEQDRGGDTRPIILAAHAAAREQCQDCRARGDGPVRADFIILIDTSPDWKAVCETCSSDYVWTDETEVETDY